MGPANIHLYCLKKCYDFMDLVPEKQYLLQ